MGLFSGRKALASSTFLGIGANATPNAEIIPPAPAAPASAAPAPPPNQRPAPNSAKGGKSAKKDQEDGSGGVDDGDEEDNDDEDGDDDSDEEEMRRGSSSTICRARRRERSRISAIMGHPSAAKNPDFAAHVALNMNIGRQAACALLDRSPTAAAAAAAPAPTSLTTRMEEFRGIAAPSTMPSSTEKQAQESVLSAAFEKHAVTPKKRS